MSLKLTPMMKVAALLLGAFFLLNNGDNPPNGYTGAPGENLCTSCHSNGNPGGFGGNITITGLPANIAPNMVYPLTVTVTKTQGNPQEAGFQLVALNSANANAGSLSSGTTNPTVQASGGRTYVEHNPAQSFGANSSVSWSFNWTAPAGPDGVVITLYAAANLANGNNNSSGDFIITQTASTTMVGGVTPLSASITASQNVSCNGGNNGQATVTALNGTPPYTYLWSNGNQNATVTNLTAGNHSVTVTDNAGVSVTASVNITQPTVLNLTVSSFNNVTCAGLGSATVAASGGTPNYTYAWPNGTSGATAFNLMSGSYVVTATDNKGCTKTVTVNIQQNNTPPLAVANAGGQITCTTTQVVVSGNGSSTGGNMSYQWTTSNGHIVSGATAINATVNAAGTYTLTVFNNANQCSTTANTTVIANNTPPTVSIQAPTQSITCSNPTLVLNANGSSTGAGINYLWSTTNGHIVSGGTTLTPTVNAPGNYTLSINNTSTGCSATQSVTVSGNVIAPTAIIQTPAMLTCVVDTIVMSGTGSSSGAGIVYNWTTSNGNIASGANTLTPAVTAPGQYFLAVTNNVNGCVSIDTATVAENTTQPTAIVVPPSPLACGNASATLSGTGSSTGANMTYQWTSANGNITSGANSLQATVDATGTYCLEVTNMTNGCSSTACQSLSQAAPPTLSAMSTASVSCAGESNGAALASATGGASPYVFAWSNGANTAAISGLAANTYTVSVTDANGCQNTASVSIAEPAPLVSNATATGETFAGGNNGTATVNPTGGTSPYSVLWSTGAMTNTISGLTPGSYSVEITDANGCTTSGSVQVNNFNCTLSLNTSTTPTSCFGGTDGGAEAELLGGFGNLSFLWSTGDTSATVSGLGAGMYGLTATDGNSCQATIVVEVTQPVQLTGQASAIQAGGCSFNGLASVVATGGIAPYTFNWPGGQSGDQASLPVGAFAVSVTDANGCQTVLNGNIPQGPDTQNPVAQGQSIQVGLNAQGQAQITAQMINNGSTDDCSTPDLSVNITNFDCSNIGVNKVVLTATDAAGNTDTDTVEVMLVDLLPPIALAEELTVSLDANGQVNISASQVDAGSTDNCAVASLSLSQTNFTCNDLGVNTIVLTVTDGSGNTATDSVEITVIDPIAPFIICPSDIVSNACEVALFYDLPEFSDNCGSTELSLTGGLPSGVLFPVGQTLVEYQATDASGNSAACSFTVTVQSDLVITEITAQVNCPGIASELSATVAGGTAPYAYLWNNGDTTPSTSTLEDMAVLTVTDAQGCVVIDEIILNLPQPIVIDGQITPATGAAANGSIVPSVAGGTGGYQFAWFFNGNVISTQPQLINITGGIYTLVVTDEQGCTGAREFTVDIINSTAEEAFIRNWTAFPNPFDSYLRVELALEQPMPVRLSLLDLTGRPLLVEAPGLIMNWRSDLQMESLPAGLYILQLQVGDKLVLKKLIKE